MSKKDMEKMKALIEAKKNKQNGNQHIIPEKKIGSSHGGNTNMKTGGSNNKV